jgi:hypothetical protein
MAGRRRPLAGGALVAAVALVGAGVGPAAAEDPTQILPGTTVMAITADLDGDGDREIVRLTEEGQAMDHAVDAWEYDGARWSTIGSAELSRVGEYQDALSQGGDPAAILRVQMAGRERVLALSAAFVPGDPNLATCCLTISELQLARAGSLELRRLQRVDGGAQTIWATDMDGDGSDELVLHESAYATTEEEQTATIRVLRWNGSGFDEVFEHTDRQLLYGVTVGDSDGVAGQDVLLAPGTDGRIRRLAWVEGGIRLEQASIDAGEPPEGWIVGVADDAIVLSLGQELRVVRWPRGQSATTVDRLGTLAYPGVGLVGEGPDALVVVQSDFPFGNRRVPTAAIHDLRLRSLGEVAANPATEGLWEFLGGPVAGAQGSIQRNIYPWSGPFYGGLSEGSPAYVSSGMLIQPGGPDGFTVRPIASLIGVQPIGRAGPDDAWVVLTGGYSPPPGVAYLTWGGSPGDWGRLAVTRLDRLLVADDETNATSFELRGAVETARDPHGSMLMAEGDGFQVSITAPAGSAVIVANGMLLDEHQVGTEPLLIDVAPLNRRQESNQSLEATILVVTPDGRATTQRWSGTFVREPPEIEVSATTDVMALSATLAGHASQGSQVIANELPIETDAEGQFTASIDAPLWPSRVVVTARDPLGNEATAVVEVLGVVDYRGLPWAAILLAVTLMAGGVLYARTPQHRAATIPEGDARLEELELDAVDGSEPVGRAIR